MLTHAIIMISSTPESVMRGLTKDEVKKPNDEQDAQAPDKDLKQDVGASHAATHGAIDCALTAIGEIAKDTANSGYYNHN